MSSTRIHKVAVIPGDGIGIEVTAAAIEALKTVQAKVGGFELVFTEYNYGSRLYKETGSYTPKDWLDTLSRHDAIFFGAVGDPDVPDHISLWQLILPMRYMLDFFQYVNVRPSIVFEGIDPPTRCATPAGGELDWVMLRENTEGEYAGQGGRSHVGHPHEVATEVAIFSRIGIERFLRFAFETAQNRPRKLLTVVTKSNAQRYGLVLWDEVAAEVAKDFPDVDAMTVRMVSKPQTLDVIAATNLHADILSDLAAALSGSIGIAPSSNLDPTRKAPSLFEPVHGAAFDIMGKDLANPVAAIWSASEMLRWLGEDRAADLVYEAMKSSLRAGKKTRDLGGTLSTTEATKAICDLIQEIEVQ
ncbi:hypothetical protein D9758_006824 [Tetrapyrgos nigripes]|uniref:Isopropylmalate dehydrogenase-like domain-containing protein n=1 Tax=Tetrapyrgos nigripes TaxID=182062 RepID=A0A8H5CWY9_9AGAR|nr:hypothetical protein D9758_006824 [Tetrapyrgos nigripes]